MKWLAALVFGLIVGTLLPTIVDGQAGVWTDDWTGWGTVRAGTGGLLFSIPLFLGSALAIRLLFNWHTR
ncbi:MAG TPA: hypothetical protein VE221_09800 [Sphingomicrobium sp.]|nr:hypothetical protein [Sphingomicrobium sp.]